MQTKDVKASRQEHSRINLRLDETIYSINLGLYLQNF